MSASRPTLEALDDRFHVVARYDAELPHAAVDSRAHDVLTVVRREVDGRRTEPEDVLDRNVDVLEGAVEAVASSSTGSSIGLDTSESSVSSVPFALDDGVLDECDHRRGLWRDLLVVLPIRHGLGRLRRLVDLFGVVELIDLYDLGEERGAQIVRVRIGGFGLVLELGLVVHELDLGRPGRKPPEDRLFDHGLLDRRFLADVLGRLVGSATARRPRSPRPSLPPRRTRGAAVGRRTRPQPRRPRRRRRPYRRRSPGGRRRSRRRPLRPRRLLATRHRTRPRRPTCRFRRTPRVLGFRRRLVDGVENPVDRVRRGHDERQRHSERVLELVRVVDVRRICDRDLKRAVRALGDGDGGKVAGDLSGKPGCDGRVDVGVGEIHERELVLLCDDARDSSRSHDAAIHENLAEPPARRETLLRERCIELVFAQQPFTNEQGSERWAVVGRRRRMSGDRRGLVRRRVCSWILLTKLENSALEIPGLRHLGSTGLLVRDRRRTQSPPPLRPARRRRTEGRPEHTAKLVGEQHRRGISNRENTRAVRASADRNRRCAWRAPR